MCTPLTYSIEVFNVLGTNYWVTASAVFAFVAIFVYILGTTVWTIAVIRIYFIWQRDQDRNRNPARREPRLGESDRDIALWEIYP